MKRIILLAALAASQLLTAQAQDDLYFVPSKKNVAKERASRIERMAVDREAYYSGSHRSVDEYNRRTWRNGSSVEMIGDSLMSDVIDFTAVEGVYPDSAAQSADSDFQLTRHMARWDGYTPADAYWQGYSDARDDVRTYSWHSPWYYSTYWDPWYDSWYWHNWYNPWYYSSWHWGGWYDPWYYGGWGYPYYGYYGGWYGGHHHGGRWSAANSSAGIHTPRRSFGTSGNRVNIGRMSSRSSFGSNAGGGSRTAFDNRSTSGSRNFGSRSSFGSSNHGARTASSSTGSRSFDNSSSSSGSRSFSSGSSSGSSFSSGGGFSSGSSRSSFGGGGGRSGGGGFGRHR